MGINYTVDLLRGWVDHDAEWFLKEGEKIGDVPISSRSSLIGSPSEGIKFSGTSCLPHKWTEHTPVVREHI